jgi:hypothetical protein
MEMGTGKNGYTSELMPRIFCRTVLLLKMLLAAKAYDIS